MMTPDMVSIKNQIHGLLLGCGIEIAQGKLQSKKNRRNLLSVLEEQGLGGGAVAPLFETIDRLEEEVKKMGRLKESPHADTSALERQIDKMVNKLYGLISDEIEIVKGKR